jgi:hypothetical protein
VGDARAGQQGLGDWGEEEEEEGGGLKEDAGHGELGLGCDVVGWYVLV